MPVACCRMCERSCGGEDGKEGESGKQHHAHMTYSGLMFHPVMLNIIMCTSKMMTTQPR